MTGVQTCALPILLYQLTSQDYAPCREIVILTMILTMILTPVLGPNKVNSLHEVGVALELSDIFTNISHMAGCMQTPQQSS